MKAYGKNDAMEMAKFAAGFDSAVIDGEATERAGYTIYIDGEGKRGGHISDLEARVEVTREDGRTMNIWIEEEPRRSELYSPERISDAMHMIHRIDIIEVIELVTEKISERVADIASTGAGCMSEFNAACAERYLIEAARLAGMADELMQFKRSATRID